MEKLESLVNHASTFILGAVSFITDHPATVIVGIVGAGTISFATQFAKIGIKFYTRIRRSHWFVLLAALLTTFGSLITYVATNVKAEDVKFSSWLTATFSAVTILYPVVKALTNFLAAYQLVKKPLEDQLKDIADTAEAQESTTNVISTSDNGKDAVVTAIEPAVQEPVEPTADF